MCGIAGIVRQVERPSDILALRAMTDALEHRGPDEGGERLEPGMVLGVRRLRIIDLVTGSQPISNEDGSIWTVQNGEVYSFVSLRDELARLGHSFRTRSDTEAIVHAYEEWGAAAVDRLRGMFAFAVWDSRRRRLVLARDRLGKKPLFYARLGNDLAFASEIQALLRVDGVDLSIDTGALGDYLTYGYVPAPATIFRGIRKLPPAHLAVWEGGRLEVRRYWQLDHLPKLELSDVEAEAQFEAVLEEAVRIRLISDVPLGALLSGGIDSSTVVALMARAGGAVKTFSVGFEESAFDELQHARHVARLFGTDHHELVVTADAPSVLPLLVRHYGEPFADSSAIPTYYVTKMAHDHVTVALNGDGGDESFAGYDRYGAMALAERVRTIPGSLAILRWGARALRPASRRRRALRFIDAAALPERERYAWWMSVITPDLRAALLVDDRLHAGDGRSFAVERSLDAYAALGPIDRLLATDVATYLPGDLLVKMDIAAMANSLETRSPLLDQEVVAFAARLPERMKWSPRHGSKVLLRRLARRLVPGLDVRRPKQGFAAPIGTWLRTSCRDLAFDALFDPVARSRGYFDPKVLERLWQEHQAGTDHATALWTILMLELWAREAAGGRATTAA